MKTLAIIEFNAFERENGTEMFAVETNMGIMYVTKAYLERKAKNIGKTINDILSNADAYVIKAKEVVERREGEEFTYTDKEGVEQTSTPNSDYLEVKRFSLGLTAGGSLNQMIASATADRIALSITGAVGGLGLLSVNQNAGSDNDDEEDDDEEIVINEGSAQGKKQK